MLLKKTLTFCDCRTCKIPDWKHVHPSSPVPGSDPDTRRHLPAPPLCYADAALWAPGFDQRLISARKMIKISICFIGNEVRQAGNRSHSARARDQKTPSQRGGEQQELEKTVRSWWKVKWKRKPAFLCLVSMKKKTAIVISRRLILPHIYFSFRPHTQTMRTWREGGRPQQQLNWFENDLATAGLVEHENKASVGEPVPLQPDHRPNLAIDLHAAVDGTTKLMPEFGV